MKKRTCILLMIFVALPLAVLFLGKKTIYLPVRTEVYYSTELADTYCKSITDYQYNWYGYLEKLNYENRYGEHTFDVNCNTIGNVTSCKGNYHDSNSNYIKSKTFSYRWDGKLLYIEDKDNSKKTYNLSYDLIGRLDRITNLTGLEETIVTRYIYNSFGKASTASYYEIRGKSERLIKYYEYTYNIKGQIATQTQYNANGTCTGHFDYTYEKDRTVVHQTTYVKGNESSTTYTFDVAGNLIEEFYQRGDGTNRTTYNYTYRKIWVPLFFSRKAFVYHDSFPAYGFGVLWNIDGYEE